jgi:hypothetical protein
MLDLWHNLGTTEGEISGERTCKRRSAKHLEFLPSLLEDAHSLRSPRLSISRSSFCGWTVTLLRTHCNASDCSEAVKAAKALWEASKVRCKSSA